MFIDQTLLTAVETIRFQPNSSLATKLVKHCQQAIDWVNDTRVLTSTGSPKALNENRIKQVVRYLKGNWASDLEKIILTELNLKTRVNIYGSTEPNAAVLWKTDGSSDKFEEQYNQVAGTNRHQNYAETLDTVTRLIGENVNQDTGRLGKYANKHFSVDVFIMSGLFTMPEAYFLQPDIIRGEHVAAVIAHELGHAVTIATGLSAVHQKIDIVRDSIVYTMTERDDETLDTKLKVGLRKLKEFSSDDTGVMASIAAGEAVLRTGTTDEKRTMFIIITTVIAEIAAAIAVKQFLTTRLISAGGTKKTSDILVTENNITFNERNADLFVSRHGMSGAMSEMLVVMHNVAEQSRRRTLITNFMATTPVLAQILTIKSALSTAVSGLRGFGTVTITSYDPISQRLDYIIKNSYGMFKNSNLPPEVISEMVAMTERAREAANDYNSQTYVKVRHFIWSTLTRLGKSQSIIAALTDANLRSDFAKLQTITTNLINNPLHFQAARLRNL